MKTARFDRIEVREICLLDLDGRTRIRLTVDAKDKGRVEILNRNGKPLITVEERGEFCGVLNVLGEIAAVDEDGKDRISLSAGGESEQDVWFSGTKCNGSGTLTLQDEDEKVIYQIMEDDRGCAVVNAIGFPTLK